MGIIFGGQTWKYEGCTFYFPGERDSEYCPSMTRPVCYVYNGAICCASECSGIYFLRFFLIKPLRLDQLLQFVGFE